MSNQTPKVAQISLHGNTELESPLHGPTGVVHAEEAEEDAEENDEDVVDHDRPRHYRATKVEVEDAGPDEGEEGAGEGADEAHQDGEVGDDDGEHDGDEDHDDAEAEAVQLQVAVQRPDAREPRLRLAHEQLLRRAGISR